MILDLYIYNEIGGYGVNPSDIQKEVQKAGNIESVNVYINSPGGYVDEGTAIANIIKSIGKPSKAIIQGFCGSIATRIALACDTVEIAPNAQFMIHYASVGVNGNKIELEKAQESLNQIDEQLIKEYQAKTGLAEEKIKSLMEAGTTMTGEEAVRMGFADKLTDNIKAVAKFNMNTTTENKLDQIFGFLTKHFKNSEEEAPKDEAPKNISVSLEDGTMLFVFSEDGEIEGKRVVLADEDGNPTDTPAPDGEHTLSDGNVITVSNGVVTSVAAPAAEMEPDEEEEAKDEVDQEKEALKLKVQELEAQLAEKEATNKTNNEAIQAMNEKIDKITALMPLGAEFKVDKPNVPAQAKGVRPETAKSGLDAAADRFYDKIFNGK